MKKLEKWWKVSLAIMLLLSVSACSTENQSEEFTVENIKLVTDMTKDMYESKSRMDLAGKMEKYYPFMSDEVYQQEMNVSDDFVYNKNFSLSDATDIEYSHIDTVVKQEEDVYVVYVLAKATATYPGMVVAEKGIINKFVFKDNFIIGVQFY